MDQHTGIYCILIIRYMFVFDFMNLCRGLYGPYSPKIRDSQVINLMRNEINRTFKGAGIFGDGHFNNIINCPDVTFYATKD